MLSVEELNDRLIDLAFAEDIGDGDHTTLCCIPESETGESKLLIKQEGIIAGVEIAKQVFRRFDPELEVEADYLHTPSAQSFLHPVASPLAVGETDGVRLVPNDKCFPAAVCRSLFLV